MNPMLLARGKILAYCLLGLILSGISYADITPYEAMYRVEYKGRHVADATFRLRHDGDHQYVFTSATKARGLAKVFRRPSPSEESVFDFVDGQITPQRYWFKDGTKKGKGNTEISFDWNQGLATSSYKQATVALPLDQPILDRITLQLQIMLGLKQGTDPSSHLLAYRNQLRRYDYSDAGERQVTTRAGDFNAVGFAQQREGSSRRTLLWMAPELSFLPVYMEQQREGKTQLTFDLEWVSGLPVKPSVE